jgi:holo-ACP synthase
MSQPLPVQANAPPAEAGLAVVSLIQMLERREARVLRQQAWRQRFAQPLVQLTLVSPGPLKDTAQARYVFDTARLAIRQSLREAACPVLAQASDYFATGPELLLAVQADALDLKRRLVLLEDSHALGRLWDIDVLDVNGAGLSRTQWSLPARRCLLCEEPAHACARSARHPLDALLNAIQDQVNAFRDTPAA